MADKKDHTLGWAQVFATIFLGVVGIAFTYVTGANQQANLRQQERDRQSLMAVQLMSQREQSEADLRQRMFDMLLTELLDPSADISERLVVFEVFERNFHDVFNARPLFDLLQRAIAEVEEESLRRQHEAQLVALAKDVRSNQEQLVREGGNVQALELAVGELHKVLLSYDATEIAEAREHDEHQGHEHEADPSEEQHVVLIAHDLEIRLDSLSAYQAFVTTISRDFHHQTKSDTARFSVSYFDAPLTDNTLLPDGHRYAITLAGIGEKDGRPSARLHVLEFAAHYVTAGYRPSLDQLNQMVTRLTTGAESRGLSEIKLGSQ